jgi:hypothetical protein
VEGKSQRVKLPGRFQRRKRCLAHDPAYGLPSVPILSRPAFSAWLAAFFLVFTGASGMAQLSWTDKKLELTSDSTAPTLEGRFHFVNSGAKPVDIIRVTTSCGCTSANLGQRHFEPGKGGDIVITYTRGSRTGTQTNLIAVQTGDPQPIMLTLVVHIPEVVRLDPAFVTWTHNEAKTPKTIRLKLVVPGKITALDVQSSDPAIDAEAWVAVPGQEYRLVVSPRDVRHFLRAVLTITCELDGKDKKTFTSYATVQPGGAD